MTDDPRDETAKALITFTNEFIEAPAGTKVALGFVKVDDEWGLSIRLGEKYLGLPMSAALGFRDVVERHPDRHPRMHDLAAMLNNGISELDRRVKAGSVYVDSAEKIN